MLKQNKKDLHIHAQRNEGCSLHPSQSYSACMYRSLLFLYVCFYPTASWVLYLNTEFLFIQSEWKNYFFFVYCGADFNP